MRFWDGSWCFLKCSCVSFLSLLGCEDHISKPHIMIILLIQTFLKRIFTLFTLPSSQAISVFIKKSKFICWEYSQNLMRILVFVTCHDICLVFIYVRINISEHDNQNRLVLVRKQNVTNDMKLCKFLFWSLVAFWCSLLYITWEYSVWNRFSARYTKYWLACCHYSIEPLMIQSSKMSWGGILKPDHNERSCSY